MKERIKALPVIGPLAVRLFRLFYYRLPTHYPGTPRARAAVRQALALGVEYTYGSEIEGDLAEFGTMSGETALTLGRAMMEMEQLYKRSPRRLHLFDSFQGLPVPASSVDRDCVHVRSGTWTPGACMVLTKERLAFKMREVLPESRWSIRDGWFKDTLPHLPDSLRLALLHVDCDLYESTLDALDPLFARGLVSPGAALFFDDWNTNRSSPDFGQRRAWRELAAKHSIVFSDEGGYAVYGRKLIVQGYRHFPQ